MWQGSTRAVAGSIWHGRQMMGVGGMAADPTPEAQVSRRHVTTCAQRTGGAQ